MDITHVIAFNLTLLAAMASPGPALLIALRTSVVDGHLAGIATGVGLGLVASLWTLAALMGLDGLFVLVPWAYGALKFAGAVYLLWIAVSTWRGATRELASVDSAGRKAFMTGALVNLSNPKSVLFAAAVLLVIFPADLSGGEKAFIVLNHFIVECVVYTLFAVVMSRGAISRSYLRAKPLFDRIAASVLGVLGLKLLTDR